MTKEEWNKTAHELAVIIGNWVENCLHKDGQKYVGEDEGGQLLVSIMDYLEKPRTSERAT